MSFYRPGEDKATDEVVAEVFGPVDDPGGAGVRVGPGSG